MNGRVEDAQPPPVVVRILNPVMRLLLRNRLGKLIPFVLLEFSGRRSGRIYRIPTGWFETDNGALVFSPAPWRINFSGGRNVRVYRRGQSQEMVGTLETNPDAVASAYQSLFDTGVAPGKIVLKIPAGHRITAADVVALDRAFIRFLPAQPPVA